MLLALRRGPVQRQRSLTNAAPKASARALFNRYPAVPEKNPPVIGDTPKSRGPEKGPPAQTADASTISLEQRPFVPRFDRYYAKDRRNDRFVQPVFDRWQRATPTKPLRSTGLLIGCPGRPGRPAPAKSAIGERVWQTVVLAPTVIGGGGFPTQYLGLKCYYRGAVQDLCLVAEADAPGGMGGVIKVNKGGTNYVVYLVETTDPNASPVRFRTTTGIKAIRQKT